MDNRAASGWKYELTASGPLDEVELLDATWQGAPVWDEAAGPWVATDAPELVYGGPPWPGLLLRVDVPAGETLTVDFSDQPASPSLRQVFESTLIVGKHGFWFAAGDEHLTVPAESGNYPVSVWVDGATPETTRRCSIVVGAWSPRQLGPPRPERAPRSLRL